MLRAIRAMLFYLDRWREDERERKDALSEIMANGWKCPIIERAEAIRYQRSYRRAKNGNHR